MQDLPDKTEPEKTGISIIRCNNEKDLVRFGVDELARQITGKALERIFPTYLIFYNGSLRGFFQSVPQVIVYPALHPDKMSPRDFLKISRSLVTEFQRMTGNPIFMLCDFAQKLGDKNLRRIRLKRAPETAYIYDEEAD